MSDLHDPDHAERLRDAAPDEYLRLVSSPPRSVRTFTDAVFVAEGGELHAHEGVERDEAEFAGVLAFDADDLREHPRANNNRDGRGRTGEL